MEFDICEEREICPACHYHDVNAHRAPQLCDADQWYFYFFSCCQGKVGIFLYDYYMKNGSFPDDEYVERMLGFPGARPRNTLARLRAVIREKRYGR